MHFNLNNHNNMQCIYIQYKQGLLVASWNSLFTSSQQHAALKHSPAYGLSGILRITWALFLSAGLQAFQRLGAAACTADLHSQLSQAALAGLWFLMSAGRPSVGGQRGVPSLKPPLLSSVAEQLQQSGFMQHLPRLLSTAASALSELQAHEATLRDVPQTLGLTHPSLPGRWQYQGMPEALLRVVALQDYVIQLLGVLLRISLTWPEMVSLQDFGAATLQLCVTSMQHVSHCADMYPADAASRPDALEAMMGIAFAAPCAVLRAGSLLENGSGPDAAALLQSPWALQGVSILLLLTLTARPSPEALATPGSHSSKKTARDIPRASRMSGTTGSSSSSSYSADAYHGSNRVNRLSAWQYACKHEDEIPEPQLLLLKALKCSQRAFIFAAIHPMVSESLPDHILPLMRIYSYAMLHAIEQHQSQDDMAQPQQADSMSAAAAAQSSEAAASTLAVSQLCILMPSVILRWASQQKLGRADSRFVSTFVCALMACSDTLALLLLKANTEHHDGSSSEQAMDSLTGNKQQQQQHTHSHQAAQVAAVTSELQQAAAVQQRLEQQSGDTACAADAGTSTSAAAAEWLPPADLVAELLSHAYKALRKLLQFMEKVLNTSGSSSNPGSSSSSSLASLREEHLAATLQPQATSSCCYIGAAAGDCLVLNLLLLCKAFEQHTAGSGLKLGQGSSNSIGGCSSSSSSGGGNGICDGSNGISGDGGSSGHRDSERADAPGAAAEMFNSWKGSLQRHALLLMSTTEAGIRIRSAEFSPSEAVETGISFKTTAFPYLATRDATQQEQQQIFSLACSILKAISLSSNLVGAEPVRLAGIWHCCCAVMKVAAELLDRTGSGPLPGPQETSRFSLPSGDVPVDEPTARTSWPEASVCSKLDSSAGSLQLPPCSGEDATLILHWLVLMGCCFLVWAMVLRHLDACRAAGQPVTPGETAGTDLRCTAFETLIPHWLQSSTEGISTHLSAAGYDSKPLLQLLQSTAAAHDAVHAAG